MPFRDRVLSPLLAAVARLARPMNEPARFALLTRVGRILLPEYRFKWPHMEWWRDDRFNAYLRRFGELDGFNTDRRLMVHELLRLVAAVPGDTAECGVYQGAGSFLICAAGAQERRTHHIFDSFEGLSAPGASDGQHWTPGSMAFAESGVQQNLSGFERVLYHKGWIPARFDDVADVTFAFVHIDVDLAQPTRDSIAFFYPRMSAGGIIVCDDYGFTTCPGATQAIDEFLADKPEKMIRLSGGGGFMISACVTSEPPLAAIERVANPAVVV
jgi:O-methyltransferase